MDEQEKQKHCERAEQLLAEQNLAAALAAGTIAALVGAMLYGVVVNRWPVSYGFAATGIGILVGASMGFVGRGIETKFAVAAAFLTIVGCFLGNVAGIILRDMSMSDPIAQAIGNISGIDLVFWFVAIFAAVFLAKRALSRSDRLAIGLHWLRG